MKPSTAGSDKPAKLPRGLDLYHRSVTPRFEPTRWQIRTVSRGLVDTDYVAKLTIEGRNLSPDCIAAVDRHGYPAS